MLTVFIGTQVVDEPLAVRDLEPVEIGDGEEVRARRRLGADDAGRQSRFGLKPDQVR